MRKTQVLITIVDDLTGEEITNPDNDYKPLTFSVRGYEYEIDLAPDNVETFLKALGPYLDAARLVKRPYKKGGHMPRASKIRTWARKNGWGDIPDKGRIPANVRAAYLEANPEVTHVPAAN